MAGGVSLQCLLPRPAEIKFTLIALGNLENGTDLKKKTIQYIWDGNRISFAARIFSV